MMIPDLYEIFLRYPSVQTDSRKIKPGDIFFALKGLNFNGNQFARRAIDLGAAYCVCDEITDIRDDRIIMTDNVLTTLQQLAKFHREQFTIPFIAITGSNGKTTTKELVHAVLSERLKCCTTMGNLNNHIGIPLTLLSLKNDAEIAVIEMGANHIGEIEGYCKYVLPTHGLITNCGKAHLEGFGSEEGVIKAKGELYDYLGATDGIIFINNDYSYLAERSAGVKHKISYGSADSEFTGVSRPGGPFLTVEITKGAVKDLIQTKLAGQYNLPNVLSAVCIGKTFGVPDEKIKEALENYTPSNNRSQIISHGNNTVILDAYNANPSSMKVAVENFAAMPSENKILILGGMMELGKESIAEHHALIDLVEHYKWHKIVVTGEDFTELPSGILQFNSSEDIATWFREQQFENATILIKGSRSMEMEKILDPASANR